MPATPAAPLPTGADSSGTRRLLDELRQGDPSALARLFDRHRGYLERVVELRMDVRLRPRLDPSDVIQDACLEAVRRTNDYLARPSLPFRLWLRQLALDRLGMARRRHLGAARRSIGREVAVPPDSSRLLLKLLAGGPSASGRMRKKEAARIVHEALAKLADADREIILLHNFEGLTSNESAELLGIMPAAARKRYGRALLRLRQLLIDHGLEEFEP